MSLLDRVNYGLSMETLGLAADAKLPQASPSTRAAESPLLPSCVLNRVSSPFVRTSQFGAGKRRTAPSTFPRTRWPSSRPATRNGSRFAVLAQAIQFLSSMTDVLSFFFPQAVAASKDLWKGLAQAKRDELLAPPSAAAKVCIPFPLLLSRPKLTSSHHSVRIQVSKGER
jgi:hypothetical protein